MSAVHCLTLAQSDPEFSPVIAPLLGSMTVGAQLQRGSLNRFHPMIVSSSCVSGKSRRRTWEACHQMRESCEQAWTWWALVQEAAED